MWIPNSATELEGLVPQGTIEESAVLDFKREVPSNSKELAKDISAMANDGGVLIFGVGEDDHGLPTQLTPFSLDGVPERISAIARSSISPPPALEIKALAGPQQDGTGYVVVIVPPSPVAPHMVIVGKENRFYGRTAKSNIVLTEAEISRLYERRKSWEVDREALLSKMIESAPIPPHVDFGYLHLFARPVAGTDELLAKAACEGTTSSLIQDLIETARSPSVFAHTFSPGFSHGQIRPIAAGWVIHMSELPSVERKSKYTLDLELHFDGGASLFCGRAAERSREDLQIFDQGIAETTTRFFALLGALYERAKYRGPLDLGAAITGIRGAVSHTGRQRIDWFPDYVYRQERYAATARVLSSRLVEQPIEVARTLLSRFFHATLGSHFDPLDRPNAG